MLKTEDKGHIHDCGVMDPVLPQTILTPCVAMIRTHQGVCVRKALEKRSESLIHPLEASQLSACALLRIVVFPRRSTWIDRAVPSRPRASTERVSPRLMNKSPLPIQF